MGVATPDALVQLVHSPNCTREHIAGLARVVLDAADAGGQVAIAIRDRAVGHLATAAAAVAHAMLTKALERAIAGQSPSLDIPIALRGGLLEDDFLRASVGYNIGERMIDLKRDFLPIASWRVTKPQLDAVVGAALLAQKASQI
jgi:N-acetylglucosamine kinase-like BadF-type ATPase